MVKERDRRLGELLKEEISKIIRREVRDPRIGDFVSVTEVDVSGDLRHAKVYISVMGSEKEKQETMDGLSEANGYIRCLVGERITVYHTPELVFKYDESIEHGIHISEIIKEARAEDKQAMEKRQNSDQENDNEETADSGEKQEERKD
ncbi:30S ribosome-binding factor RbfA [Halarsenatibacter silvermanii]|uniref:Ribosome-binding factor A n=1 Tax=Halarsenatibacter silvermanii TaxID=321763 RepID=A0A1G9LHR8_9FIRM|nr:30S ribosome-binding factor RbfA [Halarsenatibacter silvermanii]SDL61407.1 ribosome-binding factor A [Halarsenatibacter silvermanii]